MKKRVATPRMTERLMVWPLWNLSDGGASSASGPLLCLHLLWPTRPGWDLPSVGRPSRVVEVGLVEVGDDGGKQKADAVDGEERAS